MGETRDLDTGYKRMGKGREQGQVARMVTKEGYNQV